MVVLRGSLDLYRAKGEISLILAEVDVTALLGRLAAQRAAAAAAARGRGPAAAQRRAAAAGGPAARRARGQPGTRRAAATSSASSRARGSRFRVSHVPVRVQGPAAPAVHRPGADGAQPQRLRRHRRRARRGSAGRPGRLRARGGGPGRRRRRPSRSSPASGTPGDETVADIVAARVCITPTECGQQIVAATRLVVGRPRGRTGRAVGPPGPDLPRRRPGSATPRPVAA